MWQYWKPFWKSHDSSASLGLKCLAVLMAGYLFADQVTAASSKYLAVTYVEETGKEAGQRLVSAEEVLPHSSPCLRLAVRRSCTQTRRPTSEQNRPEMGAPRDIARQIQTQSSRLRC